MKAKRSALLVLVLCLVGASAFAQIAPNNQGDLGLFTMPTADNPRAGQLTLGLYGWGERLVAGELPTDADHLTRLYDHWAVEGSVGMGLTDHWSLLPRSRPNESNTSRAGLMRAPLTPSLARPGPTARSKVVTPPPVHVTPAIIVSSPVP